MMKTKVSKSLNILIRATIILLTLFFLYDQLFNRRDYRSLFDFLPQFVHDPDFLFLFLLVIILVPVNLFLEIWKWRYLIGKLENVSYWNATKAVLTGISVSMFMPNRVGEYLGRIYVLKTAGRIRAILITFLGSMAQLLTTLLFGLVALLFFLPGHFLDLTVRFNFWLFSGLIFAVGFLIFIMIFAYLNFSFFSEIIKRISGRMYSKIKKFSEVFSWYSIHNLLIVLLISILRYFVFSMQFFILLHIFHVPLNYFNAIILISLVYFLMTIIPTIAITELGVRGSVAIYIFSLYFEPLNLWTDQLSIGVFSASTILWFFNLGMPALLGIFFVYSLRFFRNTA